MRQVTPVPTVEEFAAWAHAQVDKFVGDWQKGQQEDPDIYPTELGSMEEWSEQLTIYNEVYP